MNLFKKKKPEERAHEAKGDPLTHIEDNDPLAFVKTKAETEDERWEQRQYDMARQLVLQYVRSVVLGKLKASPKEIARKARIQAYEFIKEMRKEVKPQNTEENDNA